MGHLSNWRSAATGNCLNCFLFVRPVLEQMQSQLRESGVAISDDQILTRLRQLKNGYAQQANGVAPDYGDPCVRYAYLYGYMPSHAYFVYLVLKESGVLHELLRRPTIHVASMGGGPGSDVLGLLKLRFERASSSYISATVYDRETQWEAVWSLVQDCYGQTLRADVRFCNIDLSSKIDRSQVDVTPCVDLYLFSYVAAEVYAHAIRTGSKEFERFLATLFNAASPGTIFAFIDNGYDSYLTWLDTTLTGAAAAFDAEARRRRGHHSITFLDVRGAVHGEHVIDDREWVCVRDGSYRMGLEWWPRRNAKLMARVLVRT